jgi:gamma-glutamylputrescine oxidase
MEKFDVFQRFDHVRLPIGDWMGKQMLALGMWYYLMLEKLR